jgi:WLM domain
MPINIFVTSVVVVVVLILYCCKKRSEGLTLVPIRSKVDGNVYEVIGSYKDPHKAADLFAGVNKSAIKFLNHLKREYYINRDKDPDVSIKPEHHRDIVRRIVENYNYEELKETNPTGKNGTSYTIEKGESVYMCLRSKETLEFQDENTILFVFLHELAHVGNKEWQHTEIYWRIFKFVLSEAVRAGIYKSVDYKLYPIHYCGLSIDYNPLEDPVLTMP